MNKKALAIVLVIVVIALGAIIGVRMWANSNRAETVGDEVQVGAFEEEYKASMTVSIEPSDGTEIVPEPDKGTEESSTVEQNAAETGLSSANPSYKSLRLNDYGTSGKDFIIYGFNQFGMLAGEFSLVNLVGNYDTAFVALDYNPLSTQNVIDLFSLDDMLKWGDIYESRADHFYEFCEPADVTAYRTAANDSLLIKFPILGTGVQVKEAMNGSQWYIYREGLPGLNMIGIDTGTTKTDNPAEIAEIINSVMERYGKPSGCFWKVDDITGTANMSNTSDEYILYWERDNYVVGIVIADKLSSGSAWSSNIEAVALYSKDAWTTIVSDVRDAQAPAESRWEQIDLSVLAG